MRILFRHLKEGRAVFYSKSDVVCIDSFFCDSGIKSERVVKPFLDDEMLFIIKPVGSECHIEGVVFFRFFVFCVVNGSVVHKPDSQS